MILYQPFKLDIAFLPFLPVVKLARYAYAAYSRHFQRSSEKTVAKSTFDRRLRVNKTRQLPFAKG